MEKTTALLAVYLTQPELAKELGVSARTLDRWFTEGKGPARTIVGRKILYERNAVNSWLSDCQRDPHARDRRYGSRSRRSRAA